MTNFDNPLNNLKIASPCPTNWEGMYGNDKVRFCGECKLNVYNLSGMTKDEAEDLLQNTEGRLCVRYYRRADGSVLTQDCPVGWRAVKRRVSNLAAAACTLVLGVLSSVMLLVPNKNEETLIGKLVPYVTPTPTRGYLMGDVADPRPTPTPKATPTPYPMMGAVAPRIEKPVEKKPEQPKAKTALDEQEKALIEKAVGKLSQKDLD
jgi:hypothetical protein